MLWLRGAVHVDSMRGTHVALTVRRDASCRRIAWEVHTVRRSSSSCATGPTLVPATGYQAMLKGGSLVLRRQGRLIRNIWLGYSPLPLRTFVSGKRAYVLTSLAADAPARLLGFDVTTGRRVIDYPIPYPGRSLDVAAGVALFSTTAQSGLYGVRLTDGAIALLGAERAHDNPQIERSGIVYEDNLYHRRAKAGITTLKFVPMRAVKHDLSAVGHTLRAPGFVRSFAMDGPRVSLTLAGAGRACDRIMHWNIPWHYTSFISQPGVPAPTCPRDRTAAPKVGSVALGGLGSAWVLGSGPQSTLVRENSVACVERVIDRGEISSVVGDRGLIVYLRRTRAAWEIGSAGWQSSRDIATLMTPVRALAVQGDRIALLRADGRVEIRSRWGSLLSTFATPLATSLSLSGATVTVLTRSHTLDVYDAQSGRLEHSWRVAGSSRGPVDVQYGVAVLTQGTAVVGIRLSSGKSVVLAQSPATVHAQIEEPGVAYQYNLHGRGFIGFVPLAKIERLLGRLS
jgi:hypothetical protein